MPRNRKTGAVPLGLEVRLQPQDAGGGGVCFGDPALCGERSCQQHIHYAEAGIALSGAARRIRRFLIEAVHEIPERQRLMRRIIQPVEGAEPQRQLAPSQRTLRLARPPHCNCADDACDAAGRAQRQGGFEGFDGGGAIVLDQRDRERSQREGGGIVAAMKDRGVGVALRRGGNLRVVSVGDAAAFVVEARIARDHEKPVDARQAGDDVLDRAVGEILLLRVAAHIGERQDCDRRLIGSRCSLLDRSRRSKLANPSGRDCHPRKPLGGLIWPVMRALSGASIQSDRPRLRCLAPPRSAG